MRRAAFLDRDGVIVRASERGGVPVPPANANEMEILPGVPDAIRRLKEVGFLVIVVTNQPDVGRGTQTREEVEAMHSVLMDSLMLDGIEVCYTATDNEGCARRKPQPGMLLDAAKKFALDLGQSYMVGDRWRDIEAGNNAGCRTIFLDNGFSEKKPTDFEHSVLSLPEAVDFILGGLSKVQ
jgi:D-glycero-D-manno-heptose 1,7-bisphosphate phosphatase